MNTDPKSQAEKSLFESRLISFLATLPGINNSYDNLAAALSLKTGKNVNGRSITFMSRGESYAKKWLIVAMMDWSLAEGWMPESLQDWENLVWTITGKKQPVQGGDNTAIYQVLAQKANKPESLFQSNFEQLLNQSYAQT